MRCGWRIRFMSCGSVTAASTRSAGGCRTRRSAIGGARSTRSIASASCSWPATSAWTIEAPTACCGPARRRFPRRGAGRLAGQGVRAGDVSHRRSTSGRPPPRQGDRRLRRRRRGGDRSSGNTLSSWRTEIFAHHTTGASNGPTEGLNLCVKRVKRCGHGFKRFEHYRLRVLLHAGGVSWPSRPRPPRIRTRGFMGRSRPSGRTSRTGLALVVSEV